MRRVQRRNEKRKKLSSAHYNKREELKQKIKDPNLSIGEKAKLRYKLSELPRDGSPSRIRNLCEVTRRSKGVFRDFKMCRNKIREFLGFGLIPGARKKSTG